MSVVRALRVIAVCVVGLFAGWMAFASAGAAQEAVPFDIVALPAVIEAEHYDAGANGTAYSDTDGHAGSGNFRADDAVDAFVIDNIYTSGDALLGRTRDGEFTQYTVTVDATDEFDIALSVASGAAAPGVIHVDVDGARIGTVDGDTDRWFDWATRSAGTVTLDPGTHVIQLTWADGGNVNLDSIEVTSTTSQSGTCSTGTLEAEDATISGRFELGNSANASGGQYVHVPSGTGGWWNGQSASYIEFCASVATADEYRIDARLRAPTPTKRSFYVQVDNGPLVEFVAQTPLTGFFTTTVNDAGGLDPLRTSDEPAEVIADPMLWDLEPGDHTIRFYLRRDGAQLDSITLAQGPAPSGVIVPLAPLACSVTFSAPMVNVYWLQRIQPDLSFGDRADTYEVFAEIEGVLSLIVETSGTTAGALVDDPSATFSVRSKRPQTDPDFGGVIGPTKYSERTECELTGDFDGGVDIRPLSCTVTVNDDDTAVINWTAISSLAPDQWYFTRVDGDMGPEGFITVDGADRSYVVTTPVPGIVVSIWAQNIDADGALIDISQPFNCEMLAP